MTRLALALLVIFASSQTITTHALAKAPSPPPKKNDDFTTTKTPDVCKQTTQTGIKLLCGDLASLVCAMARPPHTREACADWDKAFTECFAAGLCRYFAEGVSGLESQVESCLRRAFGSLPDLKAMAEQCAVAFIPADGKPCLCDIPTGVAAPCNLTPRQQENYCVGIISSYTFNCGGGIFGTRCACGQKKTGGIDPPRFSNDECENAYNQCMGRTRQKCGAGGVCAPADGLGREACETIQ